MEKRKLFKGCVLNKKIMMGCTEFYSCVLKFTRAIQQKQIQQIVLRWSPNGVIL